MATVLHFLSIGDGSSYELHNLPFSYKVDVTDQDYTLWQPFEFEFCGQVGFKLAPCACLKHRTEICMYPATAESNFKHGIESVLDSSSHKHQSFQPIHEK